MRILTRYVLREFLVPLTYCLVGFLSIYGFSNSSNRSTASSIQAPARQGVGYFAGYVSPYLEWLIPAALLLGTLYTMWNFCRHSEITAMRANGIGFVAIVRPLLAVAALMAVFVAASTSSTLPSPPSSPATCAPTASCP
jgi:lipopolysaccharide export LptBFGC system permease protein LptF